MFWTCTECGRKYENGHPDTERAIKGGCFDCGCHVFQMPTMSGARRNQAPPTDGERGHKLLPQELRAKLPALYAQEHLPESEVIVQLKLFTPDSSWTWYATEGSAVVQEEDADPYEIPLTFRRPPGVEEIDVRLYGLVDGLEVELGYFSLRELEEVRGKLGLPIERDLHWTPKPLSEVRQAVQGRR